MTRGAVNIIVPGKLYQRANMLKWPAAQKERLYEELGVTVVVNLWSKVDPDQSHASRIYLNYPITSKRPDSATANVMARAVAALISAGHVVLIHCEAGRNRSVWFCVRVLIAGGAPGYAAMKMVWDAVPGAMLRPELESDLTLLER